MAVHSTRSGTVVYGNQTSIIGTVTGPILSGTFSGSVTIGASAPDGRAIFEAVKIENPAPNQDARGVFNAPVKFNYGAHPRPTSATEQYPPASTAAELKSNALERRLAALTEEYEAVNTQIDTTTNSSQQIRLQCRSSELFAEGVLCMI